jgi:hypothetical protein
MCQKLDLSGDMKGFTDESNTEAILQAVQEADITILAVGSISKTYRKVAVYENRLYELLRDYQNKIHVIAAPDGSEGHHPLSAKLRESGSWELIKFKLPDPLPIEKENTEVQDKDTKQSTGKDKKNDKK